MKTPAHASSWVILSLLLGTGWATGLGCQGLDWGSTPTPSPAPGDDDSASPTPTPPASGDFTTLTLGPGAHYFKLEGASPVQISDPTTSSGWDLRFEGSTLHLNGGESGPGEAWGLGPVGIGESEYDAITTKDSVVGPVVYYDEFESVMADWYDYIVGGVTHGVYSRYHVYAVQVDSGNIFKLQILNYYADVNGSLESGMISLRWARVDDTTPITVTIDARAGGSHAEEDDPRNKYTYFSFSSGKVVELTDEQAASSTAWDIGFKRYYVKLNGGVSGPKGVLGYDYQAGRVETDTEVKSFTPESELPEFEAASSASITGPWSEDRIGSILQQAYATDENGSLVPSDYVFALGDASGIRYFKFLLTELKLDTQGIPSQVTFRSAPIQ